MTWSAFRPRPKDHPFLPVLFLQACARRERDRTFWHASRRGSQVRDDEGTEVYLSLVDLDFNPRCGE